MTTDRGFTVVRRLAAPRELVFRAWTEPAHLQWFAGVPADPAYPTTVDLRVGGTWRVHLIEDEGRGRAYWTGGLYREIAAPEKLVFTWGALDGWPELDVDDLDALPVATITLNEVEGGTEMVAHFGFADSLSDQRVAEWLAMGVRAGWTETLARIDDEVDTRR
ncbi:MAG TPA: SRPBCC domain-containing protein [Cellulomonas sp.]|nr:SRPBCC domain-containing protein [Cellulomonas sp.]